MPSGRYRTTARPVGLQVGMAPFDARHRYYGLGPEITAPLPFKVPMLVQGRYFFERGNRVQTQGDAFWVFFTVYKPLSAKPEPPGQDRSSK